MNNQTLNITADTEPDWILQGLQYMELGALFLAACSNAFIWFLFAKVPILRSNEKLTSLLLLSVTDFVPGLFGCIEKVFFGYIHRNIVQLPVLVCHGWSLFVHGGMHLSLRMVVYIGLRFFMMVCTQILKISHFVHILCSWPVKYKTRDHRKTAIRVFVGLVLFEIFEITLAQGFLHSVPWLEYHVKCESGPYFGFPMKVFAMSHDFVLLIALAVIYGMIIKALRDDRLSLKLTANNASQTAIVKQQQKENEKEHRLMATMATTIFAALLLVGCPRLVLVFSGPIVPQLQPYLVGIAHIPIVLNSAINLFIYVLKIPDFHQSAIRVTGLSRLVAKSTVGVGTI